MTVPQIGGARQRFSKNVAARASAALGVVVMLAAAGPAPARAPFPAEGSALERGIAALGPRYREVTQHVAAVRTALASPSYVDRVRAIVTSGGDAAPDAAPVPVPTPRQMRIVEPLEPALRAPVAGLLAAVEHARDVVGDVPVARVHRAVRRVRAGLRRQTELPPLPRMPRRPTPERILRYHDRVERVRAQLDDVEPLRVPPVLARLKARSHTAALIVATALDAHLPALRRATAATPPSPRRAVACDTLDAAPALCVGSGAENDHDKNAALLIDTGGDDTYTNSAGGTFAHLDSRGLATVSVNVDLAGDDAYAADPEIATGPPSTQLGEPTFTTVAGQGYGWGGLGWLLDTTGDDSYSVTAPASSIERPHVNVNVQGTGIAGTGLLFDETGADSYAVATARQTTLGIIAQGAGEAGTGALVDAGLGDDSYVIDGGSIHQTVDNPAVGSFHQMRGQAYGALGEGILYDDGGKDVFKAHAASEVIPQIDDYARVYTPQVTMWIQANAGLGAALLLEGAGDTRYLVDFDATGPSERWIRAQAAATGPGIAVLEDAGGNDLYEVVDEASFERTFRQTDACLCDGAEAVVDGLTRAVWRDVEAQAHADLFSGVAIVRDLQGDDRYAAKLTQRLSFTLEDKLSKPRLPPLLRVYVPTMGHVESQAYSVGYWSVAGVVDYGTGSDRYEVVNETDVRAGVRSARWKGDPDVRALVGSGWTQGQGNSPTTVGSRALVDQGGDGDVMSVRADVSAVTFPDPHDSYEFGLTQWAVGQAALFAGGQDPVVTATTSVPVCGDPGFRGFGLWTPCQQNGDDPDHDRVQPEPGYGYAPGGSGALPKLEILPGTPDEVRSDPHGASRFPVAARAAGADGKPLGRVPLHFDLMRATVDEAGVVAPWQSVYQESAVTNKKGVAKAALPLLLLQTTGDDLIPDPSERFRVEVTFDGSRGLYPRHVVKPVEVRPPGPNPSRTARYLP